MTTPGTFVLTASLILVFSHTTGYEALAYASLDNASATCNPVLNSFSIAAVTAPMPTAAYLTDLSLVQSFTVGAGGTYSFGVIGDESGTGGPSDYCDFYYSSTVGVFYPS